jgi:hypothetical protein
MSAVEYSLFATASTTASTRTTGTRWQRRGRSPSPGRPISQTVSTLPPVLPPTAGDDLRISASQASYRHFGPSAPTYSPRLVCSDGASNDRTMLIESQPHGATTSNTVSARVRRRSFVYFTDTTNAMTCVYFDRLEPFRRASCSSLLLPLADPRSCSLITSLQHQVAYPGRWGRR